MIRYNDVYKYDGIEMARRGLIDIVKERTRQYVQSLDNIVSMERMRDTLSDEMMRGSRVDSRNGKRGRRVGVDKYLEERRRGGKTREEEVHTSSYTRMVDSLQKREGVNRYNSIVVDISRKTVSTGLRGESEVSLPVVGRRRRGGEEMFSGEGIDKGNSESKEIPFSRKWSQQTETREGTWRQTRYRLPSGAYGPVGYLTSGRKGRMEGINQIEVVCSDYNDYYGSVGRRTEHNYIGIDDIGGMEEEKEKDGGTSIVDREMVRVVDMSEKEERGGEVGGGGEGLESKGRSLMVDGRSRSKKPSSRIVLEQMDALKRGSKLFREVVSSQKDEEKGRERKKGVRWEGRSKEGRRRSGSVEKKKMGDLVSINPSYRLKTGEYKSYWLRCIEGCLSSIHTSDIEEVGYWKSVLERGGAYECDGSVYGVMERMVVYTWIDIDREGRSMQSHEGEVRVGEAGVETSEREMEEVGRVMEGYMEKWEERKEKEGR